MVQKININYIKDGNKGENSIIFDIKGDKEYGLNKSIINSLRRVLLSSIPTIAFKTDMQNTDIKILKNTTPLHNEYLLHRISMIPLFIDPSNYKRQYLFKLKVQSSSETPLIKVTSEDFDIFSLKNEDATSTDTNIIDINLYSDKPISNKEKKEIFRPFRDKYYSDITELKTTNSSLKEELELYGVPRVSVAYEDARWQSVSCASYSFKKDEDLFNQILNEKITINKIEEEDKYNFSKSLYISESERYYHRDVNCEPYWYEFKIDSLHYNTSKDLFIKSCDILVNELELFREDISNILTNDENSRISINQESENIYKIIVHGNDDTLGNIKQTHIVNHVINEKDTNILTCGYKKTHALEDIIIFHVSLDISLKSSNEQNILLIIQIFKEYVQ